MKKGLVLSVAMISALTLGACFDENVENTNNGEENAPIENVQNEDNKVSSDIETTSEEENSKSSEDGNIPREHKAALKTAQNYVDTMPFSKVGLYTQLISPDGNQFKEDAAQYAMENIVVNYNAEALEAAIQYTELTTMSNDDLLEQLTSKSQFTKEQAQYAIDNLPK